MTLHNPDKCRAAFEAWFYEETNSVPARLKDGEYKYSMDRHFWYAWQAAWKVSK